MSYDIRDYSEVHLLGINGQKKSEERLSSRVPTEEEQERLRYEKKAKLLERALKRAEEMDREQGLV